MPYMTVWVPNNVLGEMNYQASFADAPETDLERIQKRRATYTPSEVQAGNAYRAAQRDIAAGRRGKNMGLKWHERAMNKAKWLGEDILEGAMRHPGRATAIGLAGLGAAGYGGYRMLNGKKRQ